MTADLLEKPVDTTTNNDDQVFHYIKKIAILSSTVEGKFVEALCGERLVVTKAPKDSPRVCRKCKEIFDVLRKD